MSAPADDRAFDKDLEVGFEKLQDATVDGDAFVDPVAIELAVPPEPLGRHIDDREKRVVLAIRRDMDIGAFNPITVPPVPYDVRITVPGRTSAATSGAPLCVER